MCSAPLAEARASGRGARDFPHCCARIGEVLQGHACQCHVKLTGGKRYAHSVAPVDAVTSA